MKRATRQAPSEIDDRNFEKSIDSLASVGMLANEAERFRRGEDRDGGSSVAPEPSSQRKRLRSCASESRDERERTKTTSEGGKGAVVARSERWSRRHRRIVFDFLIGGGAMRRDPNSNSLLDLPVKLPLLDFYANQCSGRIVRSTTQAGSRNPRKS